MQVTTLLRRLRWARAAALVVFAASAQGAELNVGANFGNVPWEFQDASGKIVGFEVDLMTEVGFL